MTLRLVQSSARSFRDLNSLYTAVHRLTHALPRYRYYMQLKQESSGDDRKHHHMLARVVKAAKLAQNLQAVVGTEGELCDERSELEVTAYAHWISALMKRETKSHQDAIKLFGNAKVLSFLECCVFHFFFFCPFGREPLN
jgi:maltooligosyltrehalose synthase